jgi:hypothetical protein
MGRRRWAAVIDNHASGHLSFLSHVFCALPKRLKDLLKTSGELAKEVDHLS